MKTFMIIVDAQNDFITGALGTLEAKNAADYIANFLPSVTAKIVFTRDTHYSEDYFDSLEGKYLRIEHCIKGSEGWKIYAPIEEKVKQAYYVNKSSFGSYDLITLLKHEIGDDEAEFIICGFCTDICVISNALLIRAAFPNSYIIVESEMCAGTTLEKHNAALAVMKSCQIEVI